MDGGRLLFGSDSLITEVIIGVPIAMDGDADGHMSGQILHRYMTCLDGVDADDPDAVFQLDHYDAKRMSFIESNRFFDNK